MILFVDDEKREVESYVRELQLSGFHVCFQNDVDSALRYFRENAENISILVLDLMMPAGSAFAKEDTDMGLRTGVRFYDSVRARAPDLPVIVLTNVSDESVARRFSAEHQCRFLRKEDYLPFEVVEEIRLLLNPSSR